MADTRLSALVLNVTVLAVVAAPSSLTLAKQTDLHTDPVENVQETLDSFDGCRRDAVSLLKLGRQGKRRFNAAINACRENYPGADLYISCKKHAMQAAKDDKSAPEQAVHQCKRYLQVTSFKPGQPFPVFVEGDQAYFAGIGMNRTHPLTALAPPNFDCRKVKKAAKDPASLSYVLIGNHPQMFAGLSAMAPADLATKFGFTKPSKEGLDIAGIGRLYGDPRKTAATLYFPAAPCAFKGEKGNIYSGLSTYYLVDANEASATPYFGIAYYQKEQKSVTTAKLVQELQLALGNDFKISHRGSTVTYVAASDLTEVDHEQDPKNLCRQPRRHNLVGIVQSYKTKASSPEYLILANVKNLCEFGDRLGKRL